MKKIRAFTLFELLIVIVVIGILTSMTFYFGTERIRELDRQTVRDQFIDGFNNLVGQVRTSSYYYGQRYSQMNIYMMSGAHGFQFALSGVSSSQSYTGFDVSTFHIDHIGLSSDKAVSQLIVKMQPYAVGCELWDGKNQLSGAYIQATIVNQASCFALYPDVCNLKKITCQ